jgi:16S rRNA (guanine966-N2)-methyltransferase
VRVVAGAAKGRRLVVPAGRGLRPTTDRMREAVFSSLGSWGGVEGATVVDLFAGSGALGIEALSRGAASATFVDADPAAVRAVRANLDATGLGGGRVVQADALRFLESRLEDEVFDVAFVDPPYSFSEWPRLLDALRAATAVLESSQEIDVGSRWMTARVLRHGGTVVTIARGSPTT